MIDFQCELDSLLNIFKPMTNTLKEKKPFVVPASILRKASFRDGDELEIRASGGVITILPKLPSADDEYTPKQRRIIDARLAESEEEVKKGPTYGPFDTADEMIVSMKRELKKRAASKKTKHSR